MFQEPLKKHYGFHELLTIFPEAKPYLKKKLNQDIKNCQQDLQSGLLIERECNKVIAIAPWADQWYLKEVAEIIYVNPYKEMREKIIKKNRFLLSAMKEPNKKHPEQITDADIEQAKAVPIETLIEVNGAGFAHCPLHTDSTASLKVYKNQQRWWCYSCSQGVDSIDLMMKMNNNFDFIWAVKKLLNK